MTNRQFSQYNKLFLVACGVAHLPPTPRQASKFKRRVGNAYRLGLQEARRRLGVSLLVDVEKERAKNDK